MADDNVVEDAYVQKPQVNRVMARGRKAKQTSELRALTARDRPRGLSHYLAGRHGSGIDSRQPGQAGRRG